MIDWLLVWWPILLIYMSGTVIGSWVGLTYQWIDWRLDEAVPDDRARTTEEWVNAKLDELGLVADVDLGRWGPVALRTSNAFLPWRSSIALGDTTADKKDATFWIVGAHELGHAIWHRRFPRISRWAIGARAASNVPWLFALNLMLVNTLWGWSLVSDVMLFLVIAHIALMAVVLVDEALASRTAFELVASETFTRLERRSMRQKLVAAYCTYLSAIIVPVLMLVFWGPLRETLEAGQAWAQPIDPNHEWWVGVTVAALAIAVVLVAAIWTRITASNAEDRDEAVNCRLIIAAGGSAIAVLALSTVFWFLTYDRPYGDEFRVALMFAAPLGWMFPATVLSMLVILPNNYALGRVRKALGLERLHEAQVAEHLEKMNEEESELAQTLDRIDVSAEGQRKLEEQERAIREHGEPPPAQPTGRDGQGRFDLSDVPVAGSLRFWLLQINPVWLVPPIVIWLAS